MIENDNFGFELSMIASVVNPVPDPLGTIKQEALLVRAASKSLSLST